MRPRFTKKALTVSRESGFTLIETMLVITLFALFVIVAYQAIVAGAQAKATVRAGVTQQAMLRAAHNVLQYAIASGAQVNGSFERMKIDLRHADSTWLDGVDTVVVSISRENGELHVFADDSPEGSLLLDDLEAASFSYVKDGLERASWNGRVGPDSVVFSWVRKGHAERWWFSKQ